VRSLEELDDTLETELLEARRTLYSLALTCRTLSGPALDILWRDLDSLYPLLCCLPGLHTRVDDYIVSVYRLVLTACASLSSSAFK